MRKMLQRHQRHSNAAKRSKVGRYGMTCEVALANKLLQFLEEFICHLLLYLYKILKKFRKKYIAECPNIKKYAIEVKY